MGRSVVVVVVAVVVAAPSSLAVWDSTFPRSSDVLSDAVRVSSPCAEDILSSIGHADCDENMIAAAAGGGAKAKADAVQSAKQAPPCIKLCKVLFSRIVFHRSQSSVISQPASQPALARAPSPSFCSPGEKYKMDYHRGYNPVVALLDSKHIVSYIHTSMKYNYFVHNHIISIIMSLRGSFPSRNRPQTLHDS